MAECETDLLSDEVIVLLKEAFLMLITEVFLAAVKSHHHWAFIRIQLQLHRKEGGRRWQGMTD